MAWWIIEWSREKGRGRIEGTQSDPLDFDASIAMVDDFRIGEEVYIEIERKDDKWCVTKIWPDDPRFEPREPVAKVVPALKPALAQAIQTIVDSVQLQDVYQLLNLNENCLILSGSETYLYPPPADGLIFFDVRYMELANRLSIKSFRLAREIERAYLATRIYGFSDEDVALTIIDKNNCFYFIVCADLEYRNPL